MILVLLGPPGAGKGTQGVRIVQRCGVPKVSTGEIFRDLAASGTPLGLEARGYWSQGKLVPDDIVERVYPGTSSHAPPGQAACPKPPNHGISRRWRLWVLRTAELF